MCHLIELAGRTTLPIIDVGTVCASRYEYDTQWYRAKIIELLPDGRVHVHYVDWGNSAIVPRDWLMPLAKELDQEEVQAVHCMLYTYNELVVKKAEAEKYFKSVMSTDQVWCTFHDTYTQSDIRSDYIHEIELFSDRERTKTILSDIVATFFDVKVGDRR